MTTPKLYDHQIAGAEWLAGRTHGYLGDRPGLGKTRTLASTLKRLAGTRAMVVCPAFVRDHWISELRHILGPDLAEVGGAVHPRVFSYDELVRKGQDFKRQMLQVHGVNTLILDEAHFLKHPTAQRTQLLLGANGYAPCMERVYPASGTPVPRDPSEFGTILFAVFPDALRKFGFRNLTAYRHHFCLTRRIHPKHAPWGIDKVIGVKNADEFQQLLNEVMLRRTLDDVGLDVPRLFWQSLNLTTKDVGAADDTFLAMVQERLRTGQSLSEIAEDPHVARYRRHVGEIKAPLVANLVTDDLLNGGEKIVLFAHHRSVLSFLNAKLYSFGVAYVDGDTPRAKREQERERFMTDPECRVWIGQNIACQTGIDLYAAQRGILVEPDFAAYVNDQLGHRIARIGSTADRCVMQMAALAGTIDQAIVAQNVLEAKMAAAMFNKTVVPESDIAGSEFSTSAAEPVDINTIL